MDPIIFGRYPSEMIDILGSTLPEFSSKDRDKLKNGLDFIGINHYTSYYVQDCIFSVCEPGPGISKAEGFYLQSSQRNGVPIGESVCNLNLYRLPLYLKLVTETLQLCRLI